MNKNIDFKKKKGWWTEGWSGRPKGMIRMRTLAGDQHRGGHANQAGSEQVQQSVHDEHVTDAEDPLLGHERESAKPTAEVVEPSVRVGHLVQSTVEGETPRIDDVLLRLLV